MQGGKEFIHPEIFPAVCAKWESLMLRHPETPTRELWPYAVKIVYTNALADTIMLLQTYRLGGYK